MQNVSPSKQDVQRIIAEDNRNIDYFRTAVLLGLAIYFASNIINGNLANYVNERFAWLSYVAVLIFAGLGIVSAYALYRDRGKDYGQADYEHQRITWSIAIVMAIPLFLGLGIPSQPLGADAVNGSISLTVGSYDTATTLTKEPLQRNVLDWMRIFSQSAAASEFDGQQANLLGFVYREPDFPENHFMIARFTMSCCVADASAIGIPVYAPEAVDIADGEWVSVQGSFLSGLFRDVKTPILQPDAIEVVEQPDQPYLYP